MRSFHSTPKENPPLSRPGSRQSTLSAASHTEERALRRKTSATILTRTPVNRLAAPPPPPPSRSAPLNTRAPLRPRDGNAALTTRHLAPPMRNLKGVSSTTMPFDKSPNSSRKPPPMPTLAKAGNRPPVTPKIASRANPLQQQTVTVSTPLHKRAPRPDSTPTSGAIQRDEYVSPVTSFLSNNVTPRSGSRQSRVDTGSTSPNDTPSLDRADSWDMRSGLGISASGLDERLRQSPAFSPQSDAARFTQNSNDSKFFFASDAKQSQQPAPPRPIQRAQTFVYANGEDLAEKPSATPPTFTPAGPAIPGPDPLERKFVYANGTPDLKAPLRTTFSPSGPGSTVSTTSKAPIRPTSAYANNASPRPASPIKLPSYTATKNVPPLAANRAAMASAPQLGPTSYPHRQPSIESFTRSDVHSRHGSLTMAEPPAVTRLLSSHSISATSSPVTSNPVVSFASMLEAADEIAESDDGKLYSDLHSPTKASHQQDQLDELVVNARRERKVQDLEITNASLEAINRSLERQLRKQKTELRQYRRLSRSGRLSLGASTRIASTSTVEGPLNDPDQILSDLSEEESESEDDLDEYDMSESESASGSSDISPSFMAMRDAKHRKQDEKRLQVDLSKHRQLLVDSQKMNQSLKRCLSWTEELIKEGKKALEFQVRVSEVEIGGRVLAPLDEEDDLEDEHLVDIEENQADATVRLGLHGELSTEWDKELQDRDSGVELPTDGG